MVPPFLPLTHRHEPPRDGRCGEAGEDVVGVFEVREAGRRDVLAAALAPHVHLGAPSWDRTDTGAATLVESPPNWNEIRFFHLLTCPLWVLAAEVYVEWHAATSTILPKPVHYFANVTITSYPTENVIVA